MSWPIQAAGHFNPGVGMAPGMNMGTYTPEQWTALQQQNWQWTQWQQQYAQWQNQYGAKYAEQLQMMQAMGGMPPLPPTNTAPPPAPPPPDRPPPPPHENNQPLYSNTQSQPTPVPPPGNNQQQTNYGNASTRTGNNPNWSYGEDASHEVSPMVNADALKKLAEEERVFDIQFQKWEEEIEKWRKENVNHPDKQAYKEYEQKFEACREQLMERRQQMKQKRARLLSTAQPANTTSGNAPPAVSPPQNNNKNSYAQDMQSQNYKIQLGQNYQPYNETQYQNQNKQSNIPKAAYGRNNNKSKDPQDRFDLYQDMNENKDGYSNNNQPSLHAPKNTGGSSFLPTSESSKGIPGLDLVPETDKNPYVSKKQDIIDICDDHTEIRQHTQEPTRAPDYTTISKGINNILGDEKIMNMLSIVCGSNAPLQVNDNHNIDTPSDQHYGNHHNFPQNNQGVKYHNNIQNFNNQQYGNRQNLQYNRQGPGYPVQKNEDMNARYKLNETYDDTQNNMPQEQFYDNCDENSGGQYEVPNMRRPQFNNSSQRGGRAPFVSVSQIGGQTQRHNELPRGGPTSYVMEPPRIGKPPFGIGPPREEHPTYDNAPSRVGAPHFDPPPIRGAPQNFDIRPLRDSPQPLTRPNVTSSRKLLQDISGQQNINDYDASPTDRRPNINPVANQPLQRKWIEEPLFTPSIIVEYEHQPLRLKARDFIEPVHMFEYNHISKDGDTKKKDFEKEVDDLFIRMPRRPEREVEIADHDRYRTDHYSRDFERRAPRDNPRDDFYARLPPREEYERRRPDEKYDERRYDDRDKYIRRDDHYRDRERERERDRERDRDRSRDFRREDISVRSRSRDRDTRKRSYSENTDATNEPQVKKTKEKKETIAKNALPEPAKHVVMIDDLLEPPGRQIRPEKLVIILRGLPGSGKSYLAKLIRDKEAEHGGTARIMSIDDYFMQEGEIEERDFSTGKLIKKPTLKYEYDEGSEEAYINSLKRAFKRSLTDGYFSFLIYDAVNDQLKSYADIWNFSRQNGFQVYICTMELDPQACFKRNIHNRTLEDIEVINSRFFPTPSHHIQLDATTLLQNAAIPEVQMEDVDDEVIMEDAQEEVESVFTSKWEKMDDAAQLARLDGTSRPLRPSQLSMEDYLQLDDWKPNKAKPGKKTVRWADLEERREQEKMRAIGFVVGQTDWNRMTDPTMGSSALTQTKYIDRVRRN